MLPVLRVACGEQESQCIQAEPNPECFRDHHAPRELGSGLLGQHGPHHLQQAGFCGLGGCRAYYTTCSNKLLYSN